MDLLFGQKTCSNNFFNLENDKTAKTASMSFLIFCELVYILYLSYFFCVRNSFKAQTQFTITVVVCLWLSTFLSIFELCCWVSA